MKKETQLRTPEAIESLYLRVFDLVNRGASFEITKDHSLHELANELEADGLLQRKTLGPALALHAGWRLTYVGRLEWARILREARDRVWWRKYRRGIGRALLVIIPAAWTVITVLIDIFRDSIRAWLSGLFGW